MKRSHLLTFNQWLDDLVGGRSTPPPEAPSDPTLHHVQSAARQLHDLAGHAERTPVTRSLPPTWEEFMHAHHLEPSPQITRANTVLERSSGTISRGLAGPLNVLNTRPARYASNALVTAIVLAVLVAGGWRATQHYNGGPPEELATLPFAAFVQGEATPESAQPVDLLAPATADQCTITPLTVDEVVAIVQDPHRGSSAGDDSAMTTAGATPSARGGLIVSTPDLDPNAVRPDEFATDEALAGVTETFHQFEACIEAKSYFQVWATWHPILLQQSILHALTPFPLTGEEELRAFLTDLELSGPGDPTDPTSVYWPLGVGSYMSPVDDPTNVVRVARSVDQDLQNTWMPEPGFVATGYVSHYPDFVEDEIPPRSIYDSDGDNMPDPVVGLDPRLKQPSCFSIIFSWSEDREMWLIQQYPVCG